MGEALVIGLDVGNAFLKVYEGQRRRWMAPNVIDYRCDLRLVEGHAETADSWLDLEIASSPAAVKATRFYLGDLAVRRGAAARPLVTQKLRDEHTALVFVAALLRTAAHRLKAMNKAEREAYYDQTAKRFVVPVIVGVGAPVHQFEDTEGKKLFASRVKGATRGRFVTTPEYRDLGEIEVDVQRVMLYQEGVSALADYRYDDAGALRRRGELDCYAAVVDPGANTLDWATIKPDGAVDPLLTGGKDFGLAEALDQLTSAINDKYKVHFTRAQMVADLLAHDYHIPQGRERVNVYDMARNYLGRVADEVLAVLQKLIKDSQNRIGLVLIAGGGAATLRRFLEPALKQLTGVDVEFVSEPLFANAGGYYKRTAAKLAEEKAKNA
ncbi:MAG TPA: ParM/StbA family protein [Symbiobacteriaceae bacterium]|nr:ParM/StbA family protein [Symbiobacteriaceae bacterium]